MKTKRHTKILELIADKDINTQEELLQWLRQDGFDVTQATVSRDIKELRLVKTLAASGRYRYMAAASETERGVGDRFAIFAQTAVSVDCAGNMIVIKCHTGMANAACEVLDAMHHAGVVGSLAGDNTIFIVMRDETSALSFVQEIRRLLGQ